MNMTRNQVVDLLSLIVAHDNRNLSETDIAMWSEQAQRGRWQWDEAREAVLTHFAQSTEWLKPAHINKLVKAWRSEKQSRAQLESVTSPSRGDAEPPRRPPASPQTVGRIMAELCTQMGWKPTHSMVIAVACPECGAQPGNPCTRRTHRGTQTDTRPHDDRRAVADPNRPAAPHSAEEGEHDG